MQDVEPEQQRDAEPRRAGELLGGGDVLGVVEVDERPDPAVAHVRRAVVGAIRGKVELADLLLEGHAADELVRPPLDLFGGKRRGRGRERRQRDEEGHEERGRRSCCLGGIRFFSLCPKLGSMPGLAPGRIAAPPDLC